MVLGTSWLGLRTSYVAGTLNSLIGRNHLANSFWDVRSWRCNQSGGDSLSRTHFGDFSAHFGSVNAGSKQSSGLKYSMNLKRNDHRLNQDWEDYLQAKMLPPTRRSVFENERRNGWTR